VNLGDSLSILPGVGPRNLELLKQIGLETVQDLLFHLPSRYQDRTRITSIANLREHNYCLIEGEIHTVAVKAGRRPSLLCQINDFSGSIYLRFFHFTYAQKNQLIPGLKIRCFGEIRRSFNHYGFEMIHPEYRQIQTADELPIEKTLTSIYPAVQGVSQSLLRKLMKHVLQHLFHWRDSVELLPELILSQYQLTDLISALQYVHLPPADADVELLLQGRHPMQKRLAFEELIAHQLSMHNSRHQVQSHKALALSEGEVLRQKFIELLGFNLTAAQQRVISEIDQDFSLPVPMLRLLQGDVGSGKTVVAAIAMLRAVAHQTQAVLTAPTELLAEQHYLNFSRWLAPLEISVVYLGGKQAAAVRRSILKKMAEGQAQVIIGTHALFQENVQYHHLALIVIDEQHRFGVNQRLALREKGEKKGYYPHQLIMSATPIPRTLTMSAYADLDVSIIDELPPGRKPVTTALIDNSRRNQVMERVRLACNAQKQVYWVCTLIEDSEVLQCQAAEQCAQELKKLLPELSIGLIHSRLPSAEKIQQMAAFKQGQIQLLIATTVIEVGVDVPNASLMIIENSERLGLSQLHQLRGRIGRGAEKSFCVLLFQGPLSATARRRLQIMRDTQNGFIIAQEDLAIRGPGEVLGTRQAGLLRFKLADLSRDQEILPLAQQASQWLLQHCPTNSPALIHRWIRDAQEFVHV